MFLKEKRSGDFKGQGDTYGRKQRLWKIKEETTASTVMIESVMLTCAIDANGKRAVATVDIPGAFLQAKGIHNQL